MKQYICDKELKNSLAMKEDDREVDIPTCEDTANLMSDIFRMKKDCKKYGKEKTSLSTILLQYEEEMEAKIRELEKQVDKRQTIIAEAQMEIMMLKTQYLSSQKQYNETIQKMELANKRNQQLEQQNSQLIIENKSYRRNVSELTNQLMDMQREIEGLKALINHLRGECTVSVKGTGPTQVVQNFFPGSTNINQCDLPNACFSFVPPAEQNGYVLPRQAQGERN